VSRCVVGKKQEKKREIREKINGNDPVESAMEIASLSEGIE